MDQRRFVLFIVSAVGILIANLWLQSVLRKPLPPQPVAQQNANDKGGEKPDEKKGDNAVAAKPPEEAVKAEQPDGQAPAVAEVPEPAPQWFTLGSADPDDAKNPYRLLALFTNQGAAPERIEMASARYRDMEDRSGYLGHLAARDAEGGKGAKVNVVGKGTPADTAGLKKDDVITKLENTEIDSAQSLVDALKATQPSQKIELTVLRDGQPQPPMSVTLGRRPLEVVRPEAFTAKMEIPRPLDVVADNEHDPFSFLLTMWQVGDAKLPEDKKLAEGQKPDFEPPASLNAELDGVKLRSARWEGKQVDADTVEFTRSLPKFGLELVKRYKIAKVDGDKPDQQPYHLTLEVELRNVGKEPLKVAYQLDGPTGLPTEGWWYATRISREWSGAGVRDMAMLLRNAQPALVSPMQIFGGKAPQPFAEDPDALLVYAGVDAQYFAAALLPVPQKDRPLWLAQIKPILVGRISEDQRFRTLGNISCRLISKTQTLQPAGSDGSSLVHTYTVFAGPKKPVLLAQYPLGNAPDDPNNLGELIYYGWPIWAMVARPMTHILHFFYSIVGNYGLAIIMLTVLVRGCMFPLSRRQALGAQKMQLLKPEMDRINEKFKGKPDEKTRAMQELWRKHNYNPMSGCMVAFLQLPIFIGLYRSLMINVELRQAPLLGEGIRWCSNLAAPDMLFHWKDWSFMPPFLTAYRGFMSLGPFLNILPIFTVALFILQQQMFMPPATDDQTRTQQKMMKYMMVFIGYMFYTVPSGLCLYIISSSLWGIAEKQLLPKPTAKLAERTTKPSGGAVSSGLTKLTNLFSSDDNGKAEAEAKRKRRKQRGR